MIYEILKDIDPIYHEELLLFAQTGGGTNIFLNLLDEDKQLQKAIEQLILLEEHELRKLYSKIKS